MEEMSQHGSEESGVKRAKMEVAETDRMLNFATAADEFELSLKRHKIPRDPMSHRIIEKRRRDRMNNCLADLSRLIPSSYHKQGQGRIEKTEIIEMAIKHINMLQQKLEDMEKMSKEALNPAQPPPPSADIQCCATKFYMGFKEAQDEVMRFLVEVESVNAMDPFCKKIMNHLENASKKFITEPVPHRPMGVEIEKSDMNGMESDQNSHSQAFLQRTAYFPPPQQGPGGCQVSQEEAALNLDAKYRDKRLRSLLTDNQHSMANSNNGSSSLSETSSGSNGMVPLFSYSNTIHGLAQTPDMNGMGSSGYVSDLSNTEKTSPNGSISSRENVYKFKHNITKRFSQEGHKHHHMHHHHHLHQGGNPSDTSSSTSSRDLEDDQSQLKWKGNKHKGRHSVASSSNDMASGTSAMTYREEMEGHSGGNNSANSDECNSDSKDCSRRRNCSGKAGPGGQASGHNSNDNSSNSSSIALPGFILHPQGTHYMPISVHNTNITGLFESASEHEGPLVFHPISIPVHFRRPVISMPNITICTHMSSQRRDRAAKEQH